MKIFTTLFIFCLLFTTGLFGQAGMTVEIDNPCLGPAFSMTFMGTDATGRNIYGNESINGIGNPILSIFYDQTSGNWVIGLPGSPNPGDRLFETGPNTFSPNPPDSATEPYNETAALAGCGMATVSGTGTQNMGGGDPCAALGGDTDMDGVCDDNDICPGFDDNADMDMDGMPDGCDSDPMTFNGVTFDSPCIGGMLGFIPTGNDGTRNTFSNAAQGLEIVFNDTENRWEMRGANAGGAVIFFNTLASLPNPPSSTASAWEADAAGGCTGETPTVSGTGTQANEPPVVTCTEFTTTIQTDPNTTMPNVPSGGWGPIPGSGIIGVGLGLPTSIYNLDLNSCVTDDWSELGEMELSLVSSGFENITADSRDLVNVYNIRDGQENVAGVQVVVRATLVMNTPPDAVCQAVTVDAGADCMATVSAEDFDGGSTDADMDMLTFSVDPAGPYGVGMTNVTLSVSDGIATSTCTTTVTVEDNTLPVVTCTEFAETFSGEDQCADFISANSPDGIFRPIGNLSSFSAAAGASRIITADLTGCVTDNCSDEGFQAAFVDSYEENRVLGCSVDIINVLVIRDAAGNEAEDSIFFRHTIMYDGPAPEITCPADELIACFDDIMVNAANATATSGCGTPTVEVTGPVIVGAENCTGTTYTYTYTATDGCGQTSSCEQVFTINSSSLGISLIDGLLADSTVTCADDIPAQAEDFVVVTTNCNITPEVTVTGPVISHVMAPDCPGTMYTYTFSATSPCFISPVSVNRTFTIMNDGPTIVCPTDSLIDCGVFPAISTDGIVATASCGMTPAISFSEDPIIVGDPDMPGTTYTYMVTATDDCGRTTTCERVFMVQDTTAPVIISCVTDTTIYLDENGFASIAPGELLVTEDNCAPADVMLGDPLVAFDCDAAGETFTYNETDTDAEGNVSDVCTVNVTVLDTLAPVIISCVTDTTIYLDENGFASIAPGELLVTEDNCPPADMMLGDPLVAFDCDAAGETFTYYETDIDASGNVSDVCTVNVTVLDTIPPSITCAAIAPFVSVGDDCLFQETPGTFLTSDNCGDPVTFRERYTDADGNVIDDFTFDFIVGDFMIGDQRNLPLGVNTIELFITDRSGLESSCSFTLDVRDTSPPEVVCQDATVYLDENGEGLANINFALESVLVSFTDNCAAGPTAVGGPAGELTCDDIGTRPFFFGFFDGNGQEAICNFTLTIADTVAPVVTTIDQMLTLTDGEPTMTLTTGDLATATDNCGEPITIEFDRSLTFTGADIGTNELTVTATDANGNVTVTTVTVVVGFEQPNLACISEINLTLNDECQALLIPRMFLTGNTALLDAFQFDITVDDNDPSNGPIVDGCGRFRYSISPASLGDEPTIGFTGDFAPENWTEILFSFLGGVQSPPSDEQLITVDFTADAMVLSTEATVFNTGSEFGAQQGIMFSESGVVAFDYNFNGVDVGFDQAFSITTFEGVTVEIPFNTVNPESGSVSVSVEPGYSLIVQLRDDGFQPFAGQAASTLTLENFSFTPPVSPLTLDFETCWGWVNAEDKTPPAVVATPDDVDLLCVDLDANILTTLGASVSKCYRVNSGTGATIPGSMASALRARLLAGGTAPLVPTFTDGCTQEIEVCVNDVVVYDEEDPDCEDVVLTRTFKATEIATCPSAAGEGNPSVTASYTITFSRPTLDDLSADNIEDVVTYEQCGSANPSVADYPAPRTQDFPFLEVAGRTFNLMAGEAVCNIGVTFADGPAIVTCPFTYKFVRTYTVIDWCNPSDVRTFTQVVKVGDTTAPTFSGPTQDRDFDGVVDGDLIYTTNAGNVCAAYIRLDAGISATDNCSDDVTITATIYPGADLSATPIGAFDVDPTDNRAEVTSAIPVGCHLLRYTYTDECGNTDFSDYPFCVEDGTAPVAICEDGLNISISSGSAAGGASTGIAILTPSMIDAGSYDDCSGVTLEIARVGADNIATEAYDQELVLTCADLGTVRVGLKVTDAEGNMNFCWLDVLVEDKNAPSCIAPGPVEISCIVARATLPDDIMEATEAELDATFGFATGIDNCDVTITSTISGNVNSCGVGSFTRIFTATDGEGFTNTNNCRQRITVYGVHDYRLTFPTDEEGTCADVPAYAGIAADEDACDLITTDVVVDTLRTLEAGEECFKLRVTYDVINWCEYNTLGQPYLIPRDGDGIRNPETQVLYLNVNPGTDDQTTADDFAFLSRFSDRSYNPNAPQRDQLLDDGDDTDGSDDDNSNDNDNEAYAADNSRGHFRYIQFIKIYDEVAPTIDADEPADCFAGTSLTCTAEVELTFTALDECSEANVQIELDANYVAGAGFNADNPAALGVGVSLSNDGMGGFTINATNVPVGNHAVRVRASDGCGNFDVEIIEFCVEGDKAPTPICISQLTVTLMPDGQGGGMAAIWASDFIASDVEDCFGNVIDKYSIYTEEEAGAAGFAPAAGRLGIDLDCDDDSTVPVRVYAIDDNGSADYCAVFVLVQLFQDGLCGGDLAGNLAGNIATQDEDLMEGVEVNLTGTDGMDIMSLTAPNGGYGFTGLAMGEDFTVEPNYNAAVDLSEVKISDVVKIGSVILGTSDFDNGYDYVAGDIDMDGALTIFDMVGIQRVILGLDESFATGETWRFVTEEYTLTTNNWATSFPEVYNVNDLAGVLSNVDFVAIEMGNVVREGGRSALNLETEDTSLEAGQTHTMILTAAEMRGFQGTIELAAGLELIDVTFEGEGGLNLNRAGEGLIGVAMHEAISLTLEVRATEAGRLSELVSLTETLVRTEGVNLNGESTGLGLAFNGSSLAPAVSALLQNTPNPVVETTTIRFELATAGPATLSIQDAAGRVVLVRQLDALAGMNRVDLTSKDFGAAGVLTYTLTSGDFVATKKMVVVR